MQKQLLAYPAVDEGFGPDDAVGTANAFIHNTLQIGLIQNLIVYGGDRFIVVTMRALARNGCQNDCQSDYKSEYFH